MFWYLKLVQFYCTCDTSEESLMLYFLSINAYHI